MVLILAFVFLSFLYFLVVDIRVRRERHDICYTRAIYHEKLEIMYRATDSQSLILHVYCCFVCGYLHHLTEIYRCITFTIVIIDYIMKRKINRKKERKNDGW